MNASVVVTTTTPLIDLETGDGRLLKEEEGLVDDADERRRQLLWIEMDALVASAQRDLHALLTQTPYYALLHAYFCGSATDVAHHLCASFHDAQPALLFSAHRRDGELLAALLRQRYDETAAGDPAAGRTLVADHPQLFHALALLATRRRDAGALALILVYADRRRVARRLVHEAEREHLARLWAEEEQALGLAHHSPPPFTPAHAAALRQAAVDTMHTLDQFGLPCGDSLFALRPDPAFCARQLNLLGGRAGGPLAPPSLLDDDPVPQLEEVSPPL